MKKINPTFCKTPNFLKSLQEFEEKYPEKIPYLLKNKEELFDSLPSAFELVKEYLAIQGIGALEEPDLSKIQSIFIKLVQLHIFAKAVLEDSKNKKLAEFLSPLDMFTLESDLMKLVDENITHPDDEKITAQEAIAYINRNAKNEKDKIKSEHGLFKALKATGGWEESVRQDALSDKSPLVKLFSPSNILTIGLIKRHLATKNSKRLKTKS